MKLRAGSFKIQIKLINPQPDTSWEKKRGSNSMSEMKKKKFAPDITEI